MIELRAFSILLIYFLLHKMRCVEVNKQLLPVTEPETVRTVNWQVRKNIRKSEGKREDRKIQSEAVGMRKKAMPSSSFFAFLGIRDLVAGLTASERFLCSFSLALYCVKFLFYLFCLLFHHGKCFRYRWNRDDN